MFLFIDIHKYFINELINRKRFLHSEIIISIKDCYQLQKHPYDTKKTYSMVDFIVFEKKNIFEHKQLSFELACFDTMTVYFSKYNIDITFDNLSIYSRYLYEFKGNSLDMGIYEKEIALEWMEEKNQNEKVTFLNQDLHFWYDLKMKKYYFILSKLKEKKINYRE